MRAKKCFVQALVIEYPKQIEWYKGYFLSTAGYNSEQVVFVWGEHDILGYNLKTQQRYYRLSDLGKKTDPISYVMLCEEYQYIIAGYLSGNLKVWRLYQEKNQGIQLNLTDAENEDILNQDIVGQSQIYIEHNKSNEIETSQLFQFDKNSQKKGYNQNTLNQNSYNLNTNKNKSQKLLIHNFDGHSKKIVSLTSHMDKRMFWSAGLDETIRLWNLDQFTNIYTYHISGYFQNLSLLSYDRFIGQSDQTVFFGTISHQNELIYSYYGQVMQFDKSYVETSIFENQGKIKQIQFTLNNNSGFALNSAYLEEQDISKIPMSIFYPPPKTNQILQILSSPFEENQFYMLLETGEICKYRIDNQTGIIEEQIQTTLIRDQEKHITNQKANIIKFLKVLPSEMDIEINETRINFNQKEQEYNIDEYNEVYKKERFLALGCQKGSVIFVKLNNMNKIYCRISFHREKIVQMEDFYSDIHQKYLLITLCAENRFKIIQFAKNKAQVLISFEVTQQIELRSQCKL
ncbi:WD40-repeat-containing domain [Pseudocohnilembus persalinus]|uniref:WD40-repeat-containing domain n=1 Tax=Pseudocohnilembus persalinus TaxID=266149 RepID=A0A0V0QN84_PSEPJ|nr:WD40-repeat-containing domain [Pseudocohnilembus persalinus]|eukprot:KRX03596.1 WD40-repeat-containing domain [Pseudocohnilembus persalinus]